MPEIRGSRKILSLISLSFAAGIIYVLPYMRQSYHATMIEVLNISNTELGILSSVFGIFAVICYAPGGWLADRISPHKLLTFSLLTTGLAGLYFASLPSYTGILIVHAVWGVSTILTFWAAFVKANRETGTEEEQARVFGWVEGGRGLVEAVLGSIAVVLFASFASQAIGLQAVILTYSLLCIVIALMSWLTIPRDLDASAKAASHLDESAANGVHPLHLFVEAFRHKSVWLMAIIVLCAYSALWGTFSLSYFATDGFGQTEVYGATLANFRMWFRPLAAILAGYIATRISTRTFLLWGFGLVALSYLTLSVIPTTSSYLTLLWLDTGAIAILVYALRGVYFALMEESMIPVHLTGTAVGIISVIGYLPDIYFPLVTGWLFDTFPGASGHRYLFFGLVVSSIVGFAATWLIKSKSPLQGKPVKN